MSIITRSAALLCSIVMVCALTGLGFAQQQWDGAAGPNGAVWRSGNVAIGSEPTTGGGAKALLEVKRPMSGGTELLFSARSTFKESTGTPFEIDTLRAYAGGARSKESVLPADTDFAVNGTAVIGAGSIDKRITGNYKLAVGGKILAEEVKIQLVKDWPDYVFHPDYPLQSLPEVEDFLRTHHHLPNIPGAIEVQQGGVTIGEMQAKLLLKIEELTLHLIEQHKTIEGLRRKLAELQQDQGPRLSPDHEK